MACRVLRRVRGRRSVLTTRTIVLAGCWAAIAAALIATSGLASPVTSQILLASGAMIALSLTQAPRRR
jgi:hypothetical protein